MDVYNILQLGSVCSNPQNQLIHFEPRNWCYLGMRPINMMKKLGNCGTHWLEHSCDLNCG